ncbi:MAG: hypothetical protein IT379_29685 [Deltaproteobacteria bacterium]|nr:hypothetical protein [Deltaproteobacteria bacterium]
MERAISEQRRSGLVYGLLVGAAAVMAHGCCSAAAGASGAPAATSTPPTSNAPAGSEASVGAAALAGRWCGDVVQQGYPPYPMVMELAAAQSPGAVCGTSEYASLGCAGTLTCVQPEGGLARFRENLTAGRDRCVEGGVFTVRLEGDRLHWDYRRPDGALDATATLTRCR